MVYIEALSFSGPTFSGKTGLTRNAPYIGKSAQIDKLVFSQLESRHWMEISVQETPAEFAAMTYSAFPTQANQAKPESHDTSHHPTQ